MATTRTFTSLGIWAEAATTTIPVNPVSGVAYRDLTTSEALNEEGEQYNTDPNSATFNQRLFILSSFTDTLNTHGIVGWSDLVDYELPAFTWGSDNKFYFALQNSGPSGVGAQDPISAPTYWEEFVSSGQVEQDLLDFEAALADETVTTEGSRLVGHTGETVYSALTNRPTFTALAATTGSGLLGTTNGETAQAAFNRLLNGYARTTDPSVANTPFVADFNIASITRVAGGTYAVLFVNPIPTPYLVIGQGYATVERAVPDHTSLTANGFTMWTREASSNSGQLFDALFSFYIVN